MHDFQFDTLTRSLSTRHSALGGILGGMAALFGLPKSEAAAHNVTARCRRQRAAPQATSRNG